MTGAKLVAKVEGVNVRSEFIREQSMPLIHLWGTKRRLKDLLYALMLPSGNDAAITCSRNCRRQPGFQATQQLCTSRMRLLIWSLLKRKSFVPFQMCNGTSGPKL
jgi:hypothetical protein